MAMSAVTNADILVGYDFDASASDYLDTTVVAPNLTASQLTSPMPISEYASGGDTSGLDASGQTLGVVDQLGSIAIQIFDAPQDSFADAVVGEDYFTFTVSPADRYVLNLSSITFKASKQADISVDEYAVTDSSGNLIGSPAAISNIVGLNGTFDGISVDLSDAQFQNLTKPTAFRIYAWGRGADSGSGSLALLDKVVLNGTSEPMILLGYDFDADASDPAAATLVNGSVSASALNSPMAISFDSGNGDNSGLDAYGSEFGSSETLGAVGIQVTDATRQTFELAKESDHYVAFTITPNAETGAHLTSVTFKATKKHVDSVDEYAVTDAAGNLIGSTVAMTNITGAAAAYDGVTFDLEGTDIEYITEATEIRMYAWGRGSNNASGTLAVMDKVTLYGQSFDIGSDAYVATNGSDSDAGTLNQPFATLQYAIDQSGAGSTIYIRGGRYTELVDLAGVAGVPGSPITITPYGDEEVVFDGSTPITTSWTLDDANSIVLPEGNDTPVENIPGIGNVYVTTLDESVGDITQLFVDEKIMTLARFPNALAWSDDFWSQRSLRQTGSDRGYVVGEDEIAEAGVSFKDCAILHNFNKYGSGVGLVSAHAAGTNTFNYGHTGGIGNTKAYFFEGGNGSAERVMLDMAQEWAYDEDTKKLYLWADDGLDPTGRTITGKIQTYAMIGDSTTKHIVIDGLDFFATSWNFDSSDSITIKNCKNDYPSCSDRALGGTGQPSSPRIEGTQEDFCEEITLFNNTFRYSDGAALISAYTENMLVENNLFEQVNYTCLAGKAVQLAGSRNMVIRRNTLRDSGTSAGFSIGRWFEDPTGIHPYVLEYNVATGCSRMQSDGTAYYAVGGNAREAIARYNWAYDNRQRDFRWDGNNIPDVDGIWCNLYRNVSMTIQNNKPVNLIGGAYKLKGDYHEIYNNIAVQPRGDFEVSIGNGGNANSFTYNNAGDKLVGSDGGEPVPGTASNNFNGEANPRRMEDILRDPFNLDFRPRADAVELIDQGRETTCEFNGIIADVTAGYHGAAPDIGTYEYGDEDYWIPGYQYPQASMPYPADERLDALQDSDLMWLGGLGAVSYNIYLGTSADNLVFAGAQTNNIFHPAGGWTNDQTYFWRIDSVLEDDSVVEGDVWTFTINDHAPRVISARYELVEDSSVAFELGAYDPDELALSYSITQQPGNGTLSGTAPDLVYTPDANFFGTDQLKFQVNNGTSDSSWGIVIFEIESIEDAPVLSLDTITVTAASAYTGSIATSAYDPDGNTLSFSASGGPSWLSVAADGTLSGTPAWANIGINRWTVQVTDSTGLTSTETLVIRVTEGDLVALAFTDLGTSLDANLLMVDGSSDSLSVAGSADDNDYVYSIAYTGVDYDGDSLNDTLTFDVRVRGWNGSTTDAAVDADGTTDEASAEIGSTPAAVVFSGARFTVVDSKMNSGESLEFLLENLSISLTDDTKTGIVSPIGFTSARLEQTSATGNSHQAVFGEGTGLLGAQFAGNLESGTFDVGSGSLYVSSDLGGGTRSTSWGVANVDFGIEVIAVPATGYTAWALAYGLGEEDLSPTSDVENGGMGDGYNNFLEFALGMNPATLDAGSKDAYWMEIEPDETYFVYQYDRHEDYLKHGLNYTLVETPDMKTPSTQQPFDIEIGEPEDGYETVTTRYLTNDPAKFIQLEVKQE